MPTERHESSQAALQKAFPPTVSNGWLTRTLQILHCTNDSVYQGQRTVLLSCWARISRLSYHLLVNLLQRQREILVDSPSSLKKYKDICWSAARERRGNIMAHTGSHLRLAHLGRWSWVITTVKSDEMYKASYNQAIPYWVRTTACPSKFLVANGCVNAI